MSELKQQQRKTKKQRSSAEVKQPGVIPDSTSQDQIALLKQEIARLKRENRDLREQIAVLNRNATSPRQSHQDSVREQQHNFFKYSNARRY
jgi:cell division protein FtsB